MSPSPTGHGHGGDGHIGDGHGGHAPGGTELEATGAGEERAWDFFQQAETLQTHCGRVLRRTRSNPSG